MSKKSRKRLEKKAKLVWYFFDDGIWDIFIGLLAAWLGLMFFFQWHLWLLAGLIPLSLLVYILKTWLVVPRLTNVKITMPLKRARVEMGLIMSAIFIGLLFLLKDEAGLTGVMLYIKQNIGLMTGVFFGMVSFYLAYALVFQRLYFYGLLIMIAFMADSWLTSGQPFGFAIYGGMIIFFSGAYLLVKFLRAHPEITR